MKAKVIIDIPSDYIEALKEELCISNAEELQGFLKGLWLSQLDLNDNEDITVSIEVEE